MLAADGSGAGAGGTIILDSNSQTAFILGSAKGTNGVQGTVSVAGANIGGGISAINAGGALTVTQNLSQNSSLAFSSGNNGALTISNPLGNANAINISLSTAAGGGINGKISAKSLQADDIDVTAGTQPLSLSVVSAGTVNIDTKGTLAITGVGPAQDTVEVGNAAALATTIKVPGPVILNGTINVAGLTVQSTSKINGSILAFVPINSSGAVRSVVITHDSVERFAEVNPAQMFAYRAVKSHSLADGRKAFTADFAPMSAASTVLPIRQLMRSSDPEARRIASRMLKTTAILLQMQGNAGAYQQFLRPSLAAYNPR